MRRSFTHPVLLLATALLLLNDHIWKAAYPGLLTGKLSDVAGLLAFAWCLAAILPLRRWARLLAFSSTGLGFVWFKSAAANDFIMWWSAQLYPIVRVIDPTDLWALLVLPVGYLLFSRADSDSSPSSLTTASSLWRLSAKLMTLSVCVFAFAATSEGDDCVNCGWWPALTISATPDFLAMDAEYVILQDADELFEQYFEFGGGLPDTLRPEDCFRATYAVMPPEGFTRLNISTRSQLLSAGDSSVLVFNEIEFFEAEIDTAFYGGSSFDITEDAQRDLEAFSAVEAVELLELDVVTRIRINSPLLPTQPVRPGVTPETRITAFPCF